MAREAAPGSHDARVVLVGIYFIAVGGGLASQTVVGVLRDLRNHGRSDDILLAAVGLVVGSSLWWVASVLLTGKPQGYRLGIAGVIATMAVSIAVVLPQVTREPLSLLVGGLLLALPVLSLWLLYSARGEFAR